MNLKILIQIWIESDSQMGDTELKDHIEGLYAKFLTGDEAAGKEFAAYVR